MRVRGGGNEVGTISPALCRVRRGEVAWRTARIRPGARALPTTTSSPGSGWWAPRPPADALPAAARPRRRSATAGVPGRARARLPRRDPTRPRTAFRWADPGRPRRPAAPPHHNHLRRRAAPRRLNHPQRPPAPPHHGRLRRRAAPPHLGRRRRRTAPQHLPVVGSRHPALRGRPRRGPGRPVRYGRARPSTGTERPARRRSAARTVPTGRGGWRARRPGPPRLLGPAATPHRQALPRAARPHEPPDRQGDLPPHRAVAPAGVARTRTTACAAPRTTVARARRQAWSPLPARRHPPVTPTPPARHSRARPGPFATVTPRPTTLPHDAHRPTRKRPPPTPRFGCGGSTRPSPG